MALVVTPVGAARTDVAAGAPPSSAGFRVGAATADFTPPPAGSIAHDPADCVAGTPLESVFSGPRRFAFEEPYVDQANVGHYVLGDPFADCNHDGRWDGNLLGGGASTPRFYDQVADPVTARALVVSNGGRTLAVEVLDQEGVFDVYQQRIRQKVAADGFRTDGIFISATHDESAPDTLGLGGVNSETSGTNPYFVDYMVDKGARAIEQAMAAMVPARIRCVGIEMAGSVGSVETPEVFSGAISRTPQRFQDASHPAGCRTLFDANGSLAALGYGAETMMLGQALAGSVESALDGSARWSTTDTLWGTRASVCIPLTNVLFAAAAALGVFSDRPGYSAGCAVQNPVLPNGSTSGNEVQTQVAAFRIGNGEFVSVPGEAFPLTYLRSFLGSEDMPYPQYALPPWVLPHMHAQYRFVDGLAEDMLGYIFPRGNGVGVPGEYPVTNPQATPPTASGAGTPTTRVGHLAGRRPPRWCVGGRARRPRPTSRGRGRGTLCPPGRRPVSRPVGRARVARVHGFHDVSSRRPGVAVWLSGGRVVVPSAWLSLSGRPQTTPDRNTRGWIDARGVRHWLDVFPDLAGAGA
jgi:hypothetical protein